MAGPQQMILQDNVLDSDISREVLVRPRECMINSARISRIRRVSNSGSSAEHPVRAGKRVIWLPAVVHYRLPQKIFSDMAPCGNLLDGRTAQVPSRSFQARSNKLEKRNVSSDRSTQIRPSHVHVLAAHSRSSGQRPDCKGLALDLNGLVFSSVATPRRRKRRPATGYSTRILCFGASHFLFRSHFPHVKNIRARERKDRFLICPRRSGGLRPVLHCNLRLRVDT